jgi:MFS family permease
MGEMSPGIGLADDKPWYAYVTRYQWLVLFIASAGWVFDQYESQIFVLTKDRIFGEILQAEGPALKSWGDKLYAVFLLGSTLGGLIAGSLADRFGRRPMLVVTILLYSIFSGLTYFATTLWHVVVLRFLVAMGVGGEWAVAAALVAEVFPPRARAHASGIFHATSVLGIWLATISGIAIGANWRYGFLIGIVPSLLILWVRARVKEPEKWKAVADEAKTSTAEQARLGSFTDLFGTAPWNRRAILGVMLGAVGLGTYWSVFVAGQDLIKDMLTRLGYSSGSVLTWTQFAYGFVQVTGSGLGLLAFGPISSRIGRRPAFIWFQLLAMAIVPITCFLPQTFWQLLVLLPVFGFLVNGMHAGFAIYFPELFPTHLRATGASVCFNGGRFVAIPVLLLSAWLKSHAEFDFRWTVTALSGLFLIGIGVVLLLPETNQTELPE